MTTELPAIKSCNLISSPYTISDSAINLDSINSGITRELPYVALKSPVDYGSALKDYHESEAEFKLQELIKKEKTMAQDKKRIIKVFIVDPDPMVPLDKALMYEGEEKFTDLTDEELFYQLNIGSLLERHNTEVRAKTLDKKASERSGKDVYLEPTRIRNLKMVVSTLAEF